MDHGGRRLRAARACVPLVLLVMAMGGCDESERGAGRAADRAAARSRRRDRTFPTPTCGCPSTTDDRRLRRVTGVPRRAGRSLRGTGRDRERRRGRVGRRAHPVGAARWRSPPSATRPTGCPRAMVEVQPSPSLDPGEAPFDLRRQRVAGARPDDEGSNIVQKGRFGSTGGQWKLQVDGEDGEPSCVVRSGRDVVSPCAPASRSPTASWHRVVCRRDAEGVSIDVDGVRGPGARPDRLGEQLLPDPRRQPGRGGPRRPVPRPDRRRVPARSSPTADARGLRRTRATQSEASSSAKAASVAPVSSHEPSGEPTPELK